MLRELIGFYSDLLVDVWECAWTDALTGAGNRRAFDLALHEAVSSGEEFCLLLIDLDRFKKYNDTHGHPAGDALLQRLSRNIRCATGRSRDKFYRYGGEEFALICFADLRGAIAVAERLLLVARRSGCTISIGVASYRKNSDHLVEAADKALYQAKCDRNKVATNRQ